VSSLVRADTIAHAFIHFVLPNPVVEGLGHAADLGGNGLNVAKRDGYSPRCSSTMRTARSRTSREKRFDILLMAPSSQSVQPPQNPGRFTLFCIQMQVLAQQPKATALDASSNSSDREKVEEAKTSTTGRMWASRWDFQVLQC
jgi:hypothetical protein